MTDIQADEACVTPSFEPSSASWLPDMARDHEPRGDIAEHLSTSNFNPATGHGRSCFQSAPIFAPLHEKLSKARLTGTGEWLLQHTKYQAWWRGQDGNLLSITGPRGSGKSILANLVIDNLLSNGRNVAVVYVGSVRDPRSPVKTAQYENRLILYSILTQLKHSENPNPSPFPDDDELSWGFLEQEVLSHCSGPNSSWIVFDGLDECRDAELIASFFVKLATLQGSETRTIIFSRSDCSESDAVFGGQSEIRIEQATNAEDLRVYTALSLLHKAQDFVTDDEIFETAVEMIVEKAEGMFSWSEAVIESLQGDRTWEDVFQKVVATPSGLPGIYQHALRRLSGLHESQIVRLTNMFKWLLNSKRLLSGPEMREAVRYRFRFISDAGGPYELEKWPTLSPGKLPPGCQDLIRFNRENQYKFSHRSVEDYLTQSNEEQPPYVKQFQLRCTSANVDLGLICAEYLCGQPFKEGAFADDAAAEACFRENRLALYAARYWAEHLRADLSALRGWAQFLAQSKNRRDLCMQLVLQDHWDCFPFAENTQPLHFLSLFGLSEVVDSFPNSRSQSQSLDTFHHTPLDYAILGKSRSMLLWLLNSKVEKSGPIGRQYNALHIAARSNWRDVVEAAIQIGEDVSEFYDDGETALYIAAKSGSRDALDALLRCGAQIDTPRDDGDTPLIAAVRFQHLAICQHLLRAGCGVNIFGRNGLSALHLAALKGNCDIGSELIRHGAQLEAKAEGISAPMHLAAQMNATTFLDLLRNAGADISIADEAGETPLHVAADFGSIEAVRYLIERGAEVNTLDDSGQSPLHKAAFSDKLNVAQFLIYEAKADMNIVDCNQKSALHLALGQKSLEVVRFLREQNAAADVAQGQHPLIEAVKSGNLETTTYLLERSANPNCLDTVGSPPLHYAAFDGTAEFIEPLTAWGASLTYYNKYRSTAMTLAASKGHVNFVQTLLEIAGRLGQDFDVDQQNNSGWTAMHYFAKRGDHKALNLLQSKGATQIPNEIGDLPLHVAGWNGHLEAAEALLTSQNLLAKSLNGRQILFAAACSGHDKIVELVLQRQPDLNVFDTTGYCPLMAALVSGHAKVALQLLAAGATVNVTTNTGWTPLHAAVTLEDQSLITKLLDSGMSALALDHRNNTPFMQAVLKDSVPVVKLLLSRGQNGIDLRNSFDETCVQVACGNGNVGMLELLLEYGSSASFENSLGMNALSSAARNGHYHLANKLIKLGCSIDGGLDADFSPLADAADAGYYLFCKILLENNARADLVSSITRASALLLATASRYPICARRLVEAGADPYKRDCYGLSSIDYCLRHEATLRALQDATPFLDLTPTPDTVRCECLKLTVRRCLRRLVQQGSHFTVRQEYDRIWLLRALATSLMYLEHNVPAKVVFSELVFRPDDANVGISYECSICTRSLTNGNTLMCTACYDVALCSDCYARYQSEDPPKSVPKGFGVLRGLEEKADLVQSCLLPISHDPSLLVRAFGDTPSLANWLGETIAAYSDWNKIYNAENEYTHLLRPGEDFVNMVDALRYVLDPNYRDPNAQPFREVDDLIKERISRLRRTCQRRKEIQDFICAGHDFIEIAKPSDHADSTGRVLASYLETVLKDFELEQDNDGLIEDELPFQTWTVDLNDKKDREGDFVSKPWIASNADMMKIADADSPCAIYEFSSQAHDQAFENAVETAKHSLTRTPDHRQYHQIFQKNLDLEKRITEYEYSPINAPGTIRLLQLQTTPEMFRISPDIEFSMQSYHVSSRTQPYTALSYTWGRPLAELNPDEDSKQISPKKIVCDGKDIPITQNLYDFLAQLLSGEEDVAVCSHLWIDAICVDQTNLAERSSQVAMMGNIYAEAENVIVWLGREDKDSCSHMALALMANFHEIDKTLQPEEKNKIHSDHNTLLPVTMDYEGFVESPYVRNHLFYLGHFFCRSWFRRIWVQQEVLLARKKHLWCGAAWLNWDIVHNFAKYLENRTWRGEIEDALSRELGRDVGFAVFAGITNAASTGTQEQFEQVYDRFKPNGQRSDEDEIINAKFILYEMLENVTMYQATDPRDYIYAPLAIATFLRPILRLACPPPDYHKSVGSVFAEFSQMFYEAFPGQVMETLAFLADPVEGREQPPGVPTWACSFRYHDNASLTRYRPQVNVCKNWPNAPTSKWRFQGTVLHLSGIRLDTIAELSMNVEKLRSIDRVAEKELSSYSCAMHDVLAVVYRLESFNWTTHETAWEVLLKVLTYGEIESHVKEPSGYLRLDSTEEEISDAFVRLALLHSTLCEGANPVPGSAPDAARRKSAERHIIEILTELVPTQSLERLRSVVGQCLQELDLDHAQADSQLNAAIRKNSRLARDMEVLAQYTDFSPKRCMLRTGSTNSLGAGPNSAHLGDEIWFLYDSRTPWVLRPLGDGSEKSSYKIIGQAWVHGVMNGEFFNDSAKFDGNVQDIVIH